jgi:HAD superfamily hydrolase (TIGR01549 family)
MIKISSAGWEIDNIEAVLFDKDGTFIDLHYFWGKMTEMRAKEVIREFNLEVSLFEKICSFLGYDINTRKMDSAGITALYSRVKIIEIFRGNLGELGVKTSEKKIAEIFDRVSLEFYKKIDKYTKPINDAIDFIKELRRLGVKIGIVTSDSVESTNLTVRNFGWEDLFDVVIGRESSTEAKESGIPTKMALEKLELTADKAIMVGDAPMDYISAKNAGVENTILVTTGQVEAIELKKYSSFVVETLRDVECSKI